MSDKRMSCVFAWVTRCNVSSCSQNLATDFLNLLSCYVAVAVWQSDNMLVREENDVTVGPVTRTTDILTQLVKVKFTISQREHWWVLISFSKALSP